MGCETTGNKPQQGVDQQGRPTDIRTDTTYQPGDRITIEFADNNGIPPRWEQTVREDGTITLPLNQTVQVASKRKGDVERAIHELYVPTLLRRLTVNVKADQRSYFVRGEVKNPGQREHTGLITAMKAITAAGDFTDFADRSDIEIIRAGGEKVKMNGRQAIRNPSEDVPVYPGDTVVVHRRFF